MPLAVNITGGLITIPTLTVTKRLEKGSVLTHQELDDNFDRSRRMFIVSISSESGVVDNLDGISGAHIDDAVILQAAQGHTITVRHNIINLKLLEATNFDLHGNRLMTLLKTTAEFSELSRSNNV